MIGATATSYTNPGSPAQTQNNLIRITGGSDITIQDNLLGFTRWRSILMFAPAADVTIQANEFTGSFDGIDFSNPGFGPLGTVTATENLFHDFVDNGSGSTMFGIFQTQNGGSTIVTGNTFHTWITA